MLEHPQVNYSAIIFKLEFVVIITMPSIVYPAILALRGLLFNSLLMPFLSLQHQAVVMATMHII